MKVTAHGVPPQDFNCGDTFVLYNGTVIMLVRNGVQEYSYLILATGEIETSCSCRSTEDVMSHLRELGFMPERTYNVELLWEVKQ